MILFILRLRNGPERARARKKKENNKYYSNIDVREHFVRDPNLNNLKTEEQNKSPLRF